MLGRRRRAVVLGAAVLATALAGCRSDDGLTVAQASRSGTERLDALSTALVGHEQVTVPWHASSTTTAGAGCGKGEQRWVGLGTVTVRAASADGDSPPTRLVAVLDDAGWQAGSNAGDLDQEPATVVPAAPKADDPAGLRLTVTIERAADAWHYVVDLTSACAATG